MTTIQIRRGTAAQWTAANPVLAPGEIGLETDTFEFKFGDGVKAWSALSYYVSDLVTHTHVATDISDSTAVGRSVLKAADAAAARTAIGAGTSSLAIGTTSTTAKAGNWFPSFAEVTGTLSTAQLPPLAIVQPTAVASQAAMLALTAQRGDVAIRTDIGKTYILSTDNPGTLADWLEIVSTSDVTSVAGRTGAVVLAKADVGLGNVDNTSDVNKPVSTAQQTALNLKADKASPTFTGTVTLPSTTNGLTKSNVGLANVDNTSDVNKPVSTAQTAAFAPKTHTHGTADILVVDGGAP
jgi:Major tropism determinant N-terminal domain